MYQNHGEAGSLEAVRWGKVEDTGGESPSDTRLLLHLFPRRYGTNTAITTPTPFVSHRTERPQRTHMIRQQTFTLKATCSSLSIDSPLGQWAEPSGNHERCIASDGLVGANGDRVAPSSLHFLVQLLLPSRYVQCFNTSRPSRQKGKSKMRK